MKKILAIGSFVLVANYLQAQEQNTPASKLAHHIADKLKDTLGLDNQQQAKIFQVNMELYKQKMVARSRSQDRIVLAKDLQKIEGTRDSLYKSVLTEEQYSNYLQKKRRLVTSN